MTTASHPHAPADRLTAPECAECGEPMQQQDMNDPAGEDTGRGELWRCGECGAAMMIDQWGDTTL